MSDIEDELMMEAAAAVCQYAESLLDSASSSVRTRRPDLPRNREAANNKLMEHYFNDDATYAEKFANRFRMPKAMFLRIVEDLQRHDDYFVQKVQGNPGTLGFNALQKCTSAIRQLAYGLGGDTWDEYLAMSEKTSRDSLQHFCRGVIALYRDQYMRKPTFEDIQELYEAHEDRHGFPGMLGSLDCTHWAWANCPTAWRGQYQCGDHPHPTVMLEAVASQDLWIWHAFFGVAGSNNDINVLNQSPLFADQIKGVAPGQTFYVNCNEYKYGYYLVDGIYPEYATFLKAYAYPTSEKRKFLKTRQESARKDIERAFGVLKKKFNILAQPARFETIEKMTDVMYTCIILHNMVIKDKGRAICKNYQGPNPQPPVDLDGDQMLRNRREVKCRETHHNLRQDLTDYLWNFCRPDDA